MSINKSYAVRKITSDRFVFESEGTQGKILKGIIFEDLGNGNFNLAFGDVINGEIDDKVISNNNDLIIVISTVVKTLYYFLSYHPSVGIEISGIDEKRTKLYNFIFQRRIEEVDSNFEILGFDKHGKVEKYNPKKYYQKFEIRLKDIKFIKKRNEK